MPFAEWNPVGIAAALLIALGIVLLVGYASRRGLVRGGLEGMDESIEPEVASEPTARPAGARPGPRMLGAIGAVVLVAGLVLGMIAALGSWTAGDGVSGPESGPADCAQSWDGCPKSTPPP